MCRWIKSELDDKCNGRRIPQAHFTCILQKTAKNGHLTVCQWLYETFHREEFADRSVWEPAMLEATFNGHLQVCQWLVKCYNIEYNIQFSFRLFDVACGRPPGPRNSQSHCKNWQVCRWLLETYPEILTGNSKHDILPTAVPSLIKGNCLEGLNWLMYNFNKNDDLSWIWTVFWHPCVNADDFFREALYTGNISLCLWILDHSDVVPSYKHISNLWGHLASIGNLALIQCFSAWRKHMNVSHMMLRAAKHGHIDVIDWLLSWKTSVLMSPFTFEMALRKAALGGQVGMCHHLLELASKLTPNPFDNTDHYMQNTLCLAVVDGHFDVCVCLARHGVTLPKHTNFTGGCKFSSAKRLRTVQWAVDTFGEDACGLD